MLNVRRLLAVKRSLKPRELGEAEIISACYQKAKGKPLLTDDELKTLKDKCITGAFLDDEYKKYSEMLKWLLEAYTEATRDAYDIDRHFLIVATTLMNINNELEALKETPINLSFKKGLKDDLTDAVSRTEKDIKDIIKGDKIREAQFKLSGASYLMEKGKYIVADTIHPFNRPFKTLHETERGEMPALTKHSYQIFEATRRLIAYNKAIDLISEVLNIPYIDAYKIETKTRETNANIINSIYDNILRSAREAGLEKTAKTVSQHYNPVKIEFEIINNNVKIVKERIAKLEFGRNEKYKDSIIAILSW